MSALRPCPPSLRASRGARPVLAAAHRHDPEKLQQHARELRRDANAQSRNALLVNGASWLGAAATLAMAGRFIKNKVAPALYERDMSRRQAVMVGLGAVGLGVHVQGYLLRSLQTRSRRMEDEAQRIAALADDAERELREARWLPAEGAEAPSKRA